MKRWRAFFFRWRGAIIAPLAAFLVIQGRPTLESFLAGLLLTLLGEGLRLWALGYTGQPTRSQDLVAPELVTAGPYSVVRNPLYLGNVLNALGVTLAAIGGHGPHVGALLFFGSILSLAAVYGACISVEEDFLLEKFGEEYRGYRARVPTLVPRRLRLSPGHGTFRFPSWRFEFSTVGWLVLVWVYLARHIVPGST